jgi:hypothetical protein
MFSRRFVSYSSATEVKQRAADLKSFIDEGRQAQAQGCFIYAIVDPASWPDAYKQLRDLRSTSRAISLFDDTPLAKDEAVAPLVVSLDLADECLMAQLLAVAEEMPCIVWLASPLSLNDLVSKLRVKLWAELDDGTPITLRFFDPRVLPELDKTLDDSQRQRLHDVIARWWFKDRDRVTQTLQAEPHRQQPASSAALRLTDQQTDTLLMAALPDRVMNIVAAEAPPRWQTLRRAEQCALAAQQIENAKTYGLEFEHDFATFIQLALALGPAFDRNETWVPLLDLVKQHELKLDDAVARWEGDHA